MTMSVSLLRQLILGGCVIFMVPSLTHGAEHNPPKTDAEKIANAMSAAPFTVSRNAAIAEMNEDGSVKVLRKGSSEWTCVSDDPTTPGDDPMCLDPNAMEWLHAHMTKSPPPR